MHQPPITASFVLYVLSTHDGDLDIVTRDGVYGTAVGHEWRYCGERFRYVSPALSGPTPKSLTLVPHSSLTCSCGCEAPGIYNAQPGCTSLCTAWFPTQYPSSGACSVVLASLRAGCLCTVPPTPGHAAYYDIGTIARYLDVLVLFHVSFTPNRHYTVRPRVTPC